MRITTAGSERHLLTVSGNTVHASCEGDFSWLYSPAGWPKHNTQNPKMFPDEEGHPYRGPGSSFDLKLDELNVMACVQDFHMNEHGKLYEMVIKTKHAGPFSHVAVIPGNHEQIHPYHTLVRSGGYSFYGINHPTNLFSMIVKIDDKYDMKKGSRDWYMKDGEAVGGGLRSMVQFNNPGHILKSTLKNPDPPFFVFALCFNSSQYADDTEILYVGPVLEKGTRESELAGKLAGVQFVTPPNGDESSDDELFPDDDDHGEICDACKSRDDDISDKKLSSDNIATDEVGVSTKKRKYV